MVCAVCGNVRDADSAVRVSKTENGRILLDAEDLQNDAGIEPPGGLKPPGGVHLNDASIALCRNADCIGRARQDRLIESRFGVPAEEVYLRLAGMIQHAPAEKLESLIGMGIRSRKIVLGRTAVEMAAKGRKVRLLLVAAETQKDTREWVEALSRYRRIPLFRWPGPKPFEDVVHKANCRVAGVVDVGLGGEIRKQIDTPL